MKTFIKCGRCGGFGAATEDMNRYMAAAPSSWTVVIVVQRDTPQAGARLHDEVAICPPCWEKVKVELDKMLPHHAEAM